MAFTTPFAVKLVPFKLGTSEGYKVILKDHTTVGYEEFLSEVAKGSQLPLALVRGVWDNGIDVATEEMRSGKRVAVGFGDLYMVARGSVQDPTESLKDNKNVYLAATPTEAQRLNRLPTCSQCSPPAATSPSGAETTSLCAAPTSPRDSWSPS